MWPAGAYPAAHRNECSVGTLSIWHLPDFNLVFPSAPPGALKHQMPYQWGYYPLNKSIFFITLVMYLYLLGAEEPQFFVIKATSLVKESI